MTELPSPLASALADRYRLERKLGSGGMATVWLAHDLKHDRPVALKVLRPELAASLGTERFLAEIRTTARLQHPHIVPLFDSGEAAGLLYYVMPCVEGESLRARLEREKRLDVEAMLAIARPVAQALAYAHDVGIVHRDIKPENILLSRGQPFVTDFGVARAVSVAGGAHLTATGVVVGTPAYMSPEQVLGEETVDARSDVYSLGCVIYEMLAGSPPFTASTVQALLAKRLTGSPPHLPDVPAPIDEVVRRALATAPQDRFATAIALADALVEAARRPPAADLSIVVLPFENLSPDPDNAFFADGLTEELIAALTNVRALRVISRTSAMHFKGTTKSLPEITRELNVRYVLEGSVRRAGTSLRITAQLIDAPNDAHLWAERYAGTLDDVFEIQERVSEAIVEALRVRLTPAERRKLAERPIQDLTAYDAYLRAMSAVNRSTEGDLREALRQLDIARATIGDHALLHCGYGYAHLVSANMGLAIDLNLDLCEEWARKALALDPTSAKARALLGLAGCWYRGRRPSAESVGHLKRALEDDPNELHALLGLCVIYAYAGRLSQAAVLCTRYVERDPLDGWSNWLPWYMAWLAGDYQRALEVVPRGPAVSETQAGFVTWNLAWLGRSEEAIACADTVAAIAPSHVHTKLNLMVKHGLQRDVQAARAEITPEFHEWCLREGIWSYHMATAFALAGGADDALWWLEHAVDLGFINHPLIAEHDPFLPPLRSDPRFQRLMERVKKEWEEFEV